MSMVLDPFGTWPISIYINFLLTFYPQLKKKFFLQNSSNGLVLLYFYKFGTGIRLCHLKIPNQMPFTTRCEFGI